MNHIVFGEGKHDAHFMCIMLQKCKNDPTIDWFIAEGLDGDTQIRPAEESAIREFVYGRNSGQLVKSEEGKGNLAKMFAYYSEKALTDVYKCTLLADLDNNPIRSLESKVQNWLDEYYHGGISFECNTNLTAVGDLKTWSGKLESTSRPKSCDVGVVTFDDDLEAAAGINPLSTWSVKIRIINAYASDPRIQNAIEQILP